MNKTREQIEEELRDLLVTIIDVEPQELKPQAHFYQDLGVDSIKAIEILVAIEKRFKVSIQEKDIEEITTLAKVAEVIYHSLKKRGSS
ncbi:MAG: acyl carrier protein [Candidatus Omnitrophica bacterium]|nr:acyl carrier protein [Candidatus Omnitrophota bacterium]